jgi:hypothetical protein
LRFQPSLAALSVRWLPFVELLLRSQAFDALALRWMRRLRPFDAWRLLAFDASHLRLQAFDALARRWKRAS